MDYAVYNPSTKEVLTVVTAPKGVIPPGFVFIELQKVPQDAWHDVLVPKPIDIYNSKLGEGYKDDQAAVALSTDLDSQNAITRLVTLTLLRNSLGEKSLFVTIFDASNTPREFSNEDFLALAGRYLLHCTEILKP